MKQNDKLRGAWERDGVLEMLKKWGEGVAGSLRGRRYGYKVMFYPDKICRFKKEWYK